MKSCFTVKNVDLVFGRNPKLAFQGIANGKSRDEIQRETKQIVAVSGVQLEVFQGEILVLMGLSGSGKSSLLRCFNGMNGRGVGHLRGEVLFHGQKAESQNLNVMTCSKQELLAFRRLNVSMVFQQFGLMPWRSVLENVSFPLEILGVQKEDRHSRALKKLELVGLSNWKDRFPHELSGGMQQRVGLARAFVTEAPVLLMDEPFSALDPLHRKGLQEELIQLQKELGKTIIFVTHDFQEAVKIGNRIGIMDSGQLLQLDTPSEVLASPKNEKVRQFVFH